VIVIEVRLAVTIFGLAKISFRSSSSESSTRAARTAGPTGEDGLALPAACVRRVLMVGRYSSWLLAISSDCRPKVPLFRPWTRPTSEDSFQSPASTSSIPQVARHFPAACRGFLVKAEPGLCYCPSTLRLAFSSSCKDHVFSYVKN
jgi:hypothetical protein